jgi:hypothetical protein
MHSTQLHWFGEAAKDGNPAANTQLRHGLPAIHLEDTLPRCQLELAPGRQAEP